jgi:hypothetical protein
MRDYPYFATMTEAIAGDLLDSAESFRKTRHTEGRPWSLVAAVAKTWRLYRKLQKHQLV